jgi:hypothetical protein
MTYDTGRCFNRRNERARNDTGHARVGCRGDPALHTNPRFRGRQGDQPEARVACTSRAVPLWQSQTRGILFECVSSAC